MPAGAVKALGEWNEACLASARARKLTVPRRANMLIRCAGRHAHSVRGSNLIGQGCDLRTGWATDLADAIHLRPVEGGRSRQGASHRRDALEGWLLRQKVMLPDPVDGYVERVPLATRCDPTRRRVTAVHAPGGFGKTTLLAEACRRVRQRGDVVAWLTVDPEDDPRTLAAYLSFAFSEAGLEIQGARATSSDFEHGDYRINLLIHSIEAHGSPCVLALDDVHRLRDPESLALINRLLHSGPPNLHLALAFRELPARLDLATLLLEGRGDTITVDELRFDKPDIARYFDTRLSRRELNELNGRRRRVGRSPFAYIATPGGETTRRSRNSR